MHIFANTRVAITPHEEAPVVDPVAPVLLALAAILAGAKLGGDLAERIGQPAVLGELVVGILLGNLDLVGVSWFRGVAADHTVDVLARLGVVLLLFEVGLESTVGDMLKVGGRSLLVAVLGVVTPWVLGWGVGALLLPGSSPYVHAFLGATLTATSVGITARVLKDLGHAQSPEARIILGAARIGVAPHHRAGVLLRARLSRVCRGTGLHRGRLRRRSRSRGGPLRRSRPARRAPARGAGPPHRHAARAGLFRADGHARGAPVVRAPGGARSCPPVDGRGDRRQTGVRAGWMGRAPGPAFDRYRHDSAGRSRPDLCQPRSEPNAARRADRQPGGFLGARDHGRPDHVDHAACAQVEPCTGSPLSGGADLRRPARSLSFGVHHAHTRFAQAAPVPRSFCREAEEADAGKRARETITVGGSSPQA